MYDLWKRQTQKWKFSWCDCRVTHGYGVILGMGIWAGLVILRGAV
jgi:hypothetical protein